MVKLQLVSVLLLECVWFIVYRRIAFKVNRKYVSFARGAVPSNPAFIIFSLWDHRMWVRAVLVSVAGVSIPTPGHYDFSSSLAPTLAHQPALTEFTQLIAYHFPDIIGLISDRLGSQCLLYNHITCFMFLKMYHIVLWNSSVDVTLEFVLKICL